MEKVRITSKRGDDLQVAGPIITLAPTNLLKPLYCSVDFADVSASFAIIELVVANCPYSVVSCSILDPGPSLA